MTANNERIRKNTQAFLFLKKLHSVEYCPRRVIHVLHLFIYNDPYMGKIILLGRVNFRDAYFTWYWSLIISNKDREKNISSLWAFDGLNGS